MYREIKALIKFEFYEKKNKMGAVNNHSQKGVAPRKVGYSQNKSS
jgi:hypothetical protein